MTDANLAAALLAALDDHALARLAERLRPHLDIDRRLLTATQAADRLGLHPKTVVRMARDGRLPAVKVGTGWRFDPDQLHPTAPPPPEPARSRPALRVASRRAGERASVRAIRGKAA